MITVVTLDEEGKPVEKFSTADIALPGKAMVNLLPDVPALGSDEFEAYLRDWHEAHNPPWIQHPAASLKEAHQIADRTYLGWRQAQTGDAP